MAADAAVVAMLAEKRGLIARAAWRFVRHHGRDGMDIDEARQIATIAVWKQLRKPLYADGIDDALVMVVCACALDDELRSGRTTGVKRVAFGHGDRGTLSLNRPVLEDDDTEMVDVLADERAEDGYAAVLNESIVARAMQVLPERHRFVMYLHFFEDLTQDEIGEMIGVSASRVCQIVANAAQRMRPYIGSQAA